MRLESEPAFVAWCDKIEQMCERFLGLAMHDLPLVYDDVMYSFEAGVPPEQYFVEMIVSEMRVDGGVSNINRAIAEMAIYGNDVWRIA